MGKHVLAIIPARGGSKGIPGKNIKDFAGKPLIAHSIDAALECSLITQTVVSTDDEQIATIARAYGAQIIKRPHQLATDSALVIDAIRYTVGKVEEQGINVDIVLLLEPTSPYRKLKDIEQCIQALLDDKADSAATFAVSKISPNRLWRVAGDLVEPYIREAVPWLPRQQQPIAHELTGQIYALTKNILCANETSIATLMGRVFPVVTAVEEALDIDTELDFIVAEKVMEHYQRKHQNKQDGRN